MPRARLRGSGSGRAAAAAGRAPAASPRYRLRGRAGLLRCAGLLRWSTGGCARSCACCCCCWICFCFSICGMPKKICHPISTSADSTMARMCVLLVGHSVELRSRAQRALEILGDLRRTAAPRRRAVRSAHSHGPEERPVAADSLTISLRRRRTRLRSTAFPTFRDTVKPTGPGHFRRARAPATRNAAVGTLPPVAAARKSARCLSRSMDDASRAAAASGAEPLASARAARGHHLAAARCRHAGAKTVTAFAHQLARLIGPLHGSFSAGRQCPNSEVRQYLGTPRCELRNQRTLANLRF